MSGRKGYDLSNLSKETRPRTRGPIQGGPTSSDNNTASSSIYQPSFLPDSSIPSSPLSNNTTDSYNNDDSTTNNINNTAAANSGNDNNQYPITSRSPSKQRHFPEEKPQQPLRLSPGYTRTSGQYTLYNVQTGRGWRRANPDTDEALNSQVTSPAGITQESQRDMAYSNQGLVDDDSRKAELNVDLDAKSEEKDDTDDGVDSFIDFDINSKIDQPPPAAVNVGVRGSLDYIRPITYDPLSFHHNARGRHRLDPQARRARHQRIARERHRTMVSQTVVGGFLAPPNTHSRRGRRLPRHPQPDIFSPIASSALNNSTANQCLGSPQLGPTPQITLTVPSDDEDLTSFPVTRG
ncbi:hypothetical protein F4805DRAFT_476319 [Annulohypoxylon moriforme]|nr:hypothetical protein F4805DRAFT_476319 [Annulohypoxylon moriforme]